MRIVALSGSERTGGNTSAMLEWVREYAAHRGAEVDIVSLAEHTIRPCGACGDCNSRSAPCTIDDDVASIVARMTRADAVIYAAPVHGFGLASVMQTFLERAGVGHLRFERPLANKVAGVIVTGRRYSLGDVHAQLVNNALLNRMILVGSGFPALVHTSDPAHLGADAEGLEAVRCMVDRVIDMCAVLASLGEGVGALLPARSRNEREPGPRL